MVTKPLGEHLLLLIALRSTLLGTAEGQFKTIQEGPIDPNTVELPALGYEVLSLEDRDYTDGNINKVAQLKFRVCFNAPTNLTIAFQTVPSQSYAALNQMAKLDDWLESYASSSSGISVAKKTWSITGQYAGKESTVAFCDCLVELEMEVKRGDNGGDPVALTATLEPGSNTLSLHYDRPITKSGAVGASELTLNDGTNDWTQNGQPTLSGAVDLVFPVAIGAANAGAAIASFTNAGSAIRRASTNTAVPATSGAAVTIA